MANTMEVILTTDVPRLGNAGEVVKVRRGYGRNYLLPQGMAMLATARRVAEMEHKQRVVAERQRKEMVTQEQVAKQIVQVDLSFERHASDEGKLFGSVTSADIAGKLAESGFEIDRRKLDLREVIKSVGEHEVPLRLHREVIVPLVVKVASAGAPPEPEVEPEDEEEPVQRADAFEDD